MSLGVISNFVCQQSYGTLVRASTLCTSGVGGVGICGGDSGGPLSLALTTTRTLVGKLLRAAGGRFAAFISD